MNIGEKGLVANTSTVSDWLEYEYIVADDIEQITSRYESDILHENLHVMCFVDTFLMLINSEPLRNLIYR